MVREPWGWAASWAMRGKHPYYWQDVVIIIIFMSPRFQNLEAGWPLGQCMTNIHITDVRWSSSSSVCHQAPWGWVTTWAMHDPAQEIIPLVMLFVNRGRTLVQMISLCCGFWSLGYQNIDLEICFFVSIKVKVVNDNTKKSRFFLLDLWLHRSFLLSKKCMLTYITEQKKNERMTSEAPCTQRGWTAPKRELHIKFPSKLILVTT